MANIRYCIFISIIICSSVSCDKNNKHNGLNVTFNFFNFFGEEVSFKTISYVLVTREFDDYTTFEYQNNKKKEIYCVNFSKSEGYTILSNDTVKMHFIEKIRIAENSKDTVDVFKFISLSHSIDGDHYFFISSKYGVILQRSTTWPSFSELSEHYLDKNKDIVNRINSVILFNEMFQARLQIPMEEPPPPPGIDSL